MENVAYIGDDITDIPVLKNVGFSACPYDAVDECKEVVDYVCKNKGGKGCVREFTDIILRQRKKNFICLSSLIKKEAIYQLNNFPKDDIDNIVDKIISKNNIYFTGIGKSGNIALHCSDLLKCIGIRAFYLNCNNCLHGDIGALNSDDMVFLFSKSGNTKELLDLLPFLKQRCYIVGICCNPNNKFKQLCDYTIILPLTKEIDGVIKTIPTNSYMAQMFFSNILVTKLSEKINISLDKYKNNHPAGNIGKNLKMIKDILITEYPKIILNDYIDLHNVLLEMTKYSIGCCFFINKNDNLLGILSDGDIRRLLLKNSELKQISIYDINNKYNYETDINKLLINVDNTRKSKFIPIIINNKISGIVDCRNI